MGGRPTPPLKLRSPPHSKNWVPSHNSKLQPSWANFWRPGSHSRSCNTERRLAHPRKRWEAAWPQFQRDLLAAAWRAQALLPLLRPDRMELPLGRHRNACIFRQRKPRVLTVDEFYSLLDLLAEPHRTMVVVAQCLGLRVSEILALKWEDIDFESRTMRVSRAVVDGIVDDVKTECSEDELPLDPGFAGLLLAWRSQCPDSAGHWVFPSHVTGEPYHASPIQQDYIRPAGRKLGLGDIGWHTFRHTYRSWLDATGAPIGVQQKLMRHAQIATTMNVYGNALMESKREANSKIVQLVLGQKTGDLDEEISDK